MYFNTVLTDSAKLLKPLLVFSFVMLAILAGLTRIIQFRNHPVDVYCGWLLGAAIAVYLVTDTNYSVSVISHKGLKLQASIIRKVIAEHSTHFTHYIFCVFV